MKADKKTSIAYRVSIITFLMIVICSVVVGSLSYTLYRRDSISGSGRQAQGVASAVAAAADSARLVEIVDKQEQTSYWYEFEAYLDKVKTATGVEYLYILYKNEDGQYPYLMEGQKPGEAAYDEVEFGQVDSMEDFAPEAFESFESAQPAVSDFYDTDGYGTLISAFSPITDETGKTIGVVAVDFNIDDVMQATNNFGLATIIIIAVLSIVSGLLVIRFIRKNVGRPIGEVSASSKKMARGELDIHFDFHSNDEIGELTKSFEAMVKSTQKQAAILGSIADGDLTATVTPRGKNDTMSIAIKKMQTNLKTLVGQINSGTNQVRMGAQQLANGANHLAEVSIEQTTVVKTLSDAIGGVTEKTRSSAQLAAKAADLAEEIKQNARKGSGQMKTLTKAVNEISEASEAINKIIKVIDDIAFQTDILALNAAVEAARAGEHGKGFAVVADEVRNLAGKSADAARETNQLIANSIEKSEDGVNNTRVTAESLEEIVKGINESNAIIDEIAKTAQEQESVIAQINEGIAQVSDVVSQNSATAEQSAAASQQMSGQSQILNELVAKFKIK